MIRIVLLTLGLALLIFQQYIQAISVQLQFIFFITGIIVLGIPHGAADLLIATQNAEGKKKSFSKIFFFVNYLGRIMLFGIVLWLFPLAGNLLFILFAAYHFGETDLFQFKTDTLFGKLFVISYGLLILGVILLNNLEEVQPMLQLFSSGVKYEGFINWLNNYRYVILSCFTLFFFTTSFFYFLYNNNNQQIQGQFLVQFALIIFILYNLPMVLGFTFYFIVWHSILSMNNIIRYLKKDGLLTTSATIKQITLYSFLAMLGISIFGFTGIMFISNNAIMVYVFLGLAVLTAPHMQVMHEMYKSIRSHQLIAKVP